MSLGLSDLGDLARAFARLQPANDKTREAMAALLLARASGPVVLSDAELDSPPPQEPLRSPPPLPPAPPPPLQRLPSDSMEGSQEPVPAVITRIRRSRPALPQWLLATPALPASSPPGVTSSAPEPLLDPRRSRALLGTMLATPGEGPVDIEAIVRRISAGRALSILPRWPVPTLSHGVQFLVDRSDAMLPFHLDAAGLEQELTLLVGSGVQRLHFVACPTRGCGRGLQRQWKPYGLEQLPRPRTRILCVTDLGIGASPGGKVPARWEEWRDFAVALRRAGRSLGALVPYPPDRWPSELKRFIELFYWDRTLSVASAARGLLRRK